MPFSHLFLEPTTYLTAHASRLTKNIDNWEAYAQIAQYMASWNDTELGTEPLLDFGDVWWTRGGEELEETP